MESSRGLGGIRRLECCSVKCHQSFSPRRQPDYAIRFMFHVEHVFAMQNQISHRLLHKILCP